MADKNLKCKDNKPGKFYVDQNCISCDACVTAAPNCFSMDEANGHAWVKAQPQTPQEVDQCKEAMEGCPVESIGNDGED